MKHPTGIRAILDRKRAELAQVLRTRDGIAIEKSADQTDQIQDATERDLAIRNLDRESKLLREVNAALRRIDDGIFGACLGCDESIGVKRLAAIPWAACCIRCQEAAEQQAPQADSMDLLDAA
jgi:DnaK suppressor protein